MKAAVTLTRLRASITLGSFLRWLTLSDERASLSDLASIEFSKQLNEVEFVTDKAVKSFTKVLADTANTLDDLQYVLQRQLDDQPVASDVATKSLAKTRVDTVKVSEQFQIFRQDYAASGTDYFAEDYVGTRITF